MLLFCKKADFISTDQQKTHFLLLLHVGEPREKSWLYSWNLLAINLAFASGMPFPLFRRNLLKDYKLFFNYYIHHKHFAFTIFSVRLIWHW